MRAVRLVACGLAAMLVLNAGAAAQSLKTPAEEGREYQQRNALTLKQFPGLQPMQDAVKGACVAEAEGDAAKAALCTCGAAVMMQMWHDDKFMRGKLEAYLAKPTQEAIKDALNYHSTDFYTSRCAAAK